MTDSRALELELTITNACDAARNPHADLFVNAAVGNLIETLIKNPPPAWAIFPAAGSFTDAEKYLRTIAYAMDLVVEKISREAGLNAPNNISERSSIFSDALHDSDLLGDLTEAGEKLIENAMEDA